MNNIDATAPNDTGNASIPFESRIRETLQKLPPLSPSCSIYRVPERLRSLNPSAYTPNVVSIGSLHHDKKTLQDMEEHKYRYVQQFLDRTNESLEYYIQKLRYQEATLRSYYVETIKLSSDNFVTIILVDSAFIIVLFLNYYFHIAAEADRIIRAPKMIYDIRPDLLLLENQLPFYILELQYSAPIRNLCLPPEPSVRGVRNAGSPTAPSITELHQAGVKFEVGSTRNLFGIQFKNGILKIPKLRISRRMEHTMNNIAVFEQCHSKHRRIADYTDLLDCFVDTPRDVELLAEYGIVTNLVSDSSAACSMNEMKVGML